MKVFVAILFLASVAFAEDLPLDGNTAYGYLERYGIPRAEKIRAAEEKASKVSRIIGGVDAVPGQLEYQAGLLISLIGLDGTGVCGASLVSPNRLVTAAHCWFDGLRQAWKITVVLGSVRLFSGGTRIDTSVVVMHPNWTPRLARNDIAMIYIPNSVSYSRYIGPIALPDGPELQEAFVGVRAVASGFGLTSDGGDILPSQSLSQVSVNVIANNICSAAFPLIVQPTNICTSGLGGIGTCHGDSGGPLVANRNGRRILIGVTSFGSALGCETLLPSSYARVSSFIAFIKQHMH
ncbi:hypothetical protein O3G_MSEX006438 [Manduca sexta]|uniref:Peptidase S1 domain-containing protein n=1 Tax=Manduca sexta TaxID=7130 RepID=A0A921Z330_MANSE|nr:hypothetical protein O3G_MSEX006438 [Manduca sexta]KAG6450188.1 hypothetical protein O3G_MSEX006438 [Manduca sexta]